MFQVDINQVTLLAGNVYLAKFDQVILGKLQGGAFTPKAYTEAEAKKVDSASILWWEFPPDLWRGPCRDPADSQGFFDSNGFLTAAMVKACNLTLKEWVSQRKVDQQAQAVNTSWIYLW